MRVFEAVAEAGRNVASGASRAFLLMVAMVTAMLCFALADTAQVATADQDAQGFLASGGATFVVKAPGAIDGTNCDRIRGPGVVAAGALAPAGALYPVATPRRTVPLFRATTGFRALLAPAVAGSGLLVTDSVSTTFGVSGDRALETDRGAFPVEANYAFPDDGRDPTLAYAAVAIGDTDDRFDECWMTTWPFDPAKRALLYGAVRSNSTDVEIRQLNSRGGSERRFEVEFAGRAGRWLPAAATALCGVIMVGAMSIRRLELATVRHLGARRSDQLATAVAEAAMIAGSAAALAAASLAVVVSVERWSDNATIFGMSTIAAGFLGAIVGAAAVPALVTERSLIRLFQMR